MKGGKNKSRGTHSKGRRRPPEGDFADAVSASEDCILIGNFAKLLGQNGINIGQTRLFAWFRENGWLMNTWDGRRNTPTQKAINSGFFKTKENVNYVNGELRIFSPTPLLTGKGQRFFMDGFLSGRFHL
ncbi:MAG: phage antirepressor KilAC domain-containing protein [Synergistaceae bacterium]|nr:phage antirepressor KilAC domain-containing protein [Synergistaceae bacterium]